MCFLDVGSYSLGLGSRGVCFWSFLLGLLHDLWSSSPFYPYLLGEIFRYFFVSTSFTVLHIMFQAREPDSRCLRGTCRMDPLGPHGDFDSFPFPTRLLLFVASR